MAEPVRKIVIAGGGTAGWLSAVFLRDILPETVDITLVESPNIPTIGVGEATVPTFGNFLSFIGIDEHDWMPACATTFKNGILFRNWCGGNGPKSFLHPFYEDRGETFPIDQFWLQHYYDSYRRGRCLSFPPLPETCWTQAQLMLQGKAPVGSGNGNGSALRLRHAWHLDVSLLAKFLQQRAIKGGVRHIVDDIIAVRRSETKIESVQTKQHGHIDGEMFIDCTGFRRVLIGEFQGRFIDFSRYLLNDRAVAARLPHRAAAAAGLDPFTTATAMKCGWMWSIPLHHRIGTGYVYSSRFISDEEAEREFIEHSGADPDRTMRIRFQTGHLERPWEGNCVAIGLSGGFLEPLESPGIVLITSGLHRLLDYWPDRSFPPTLRDRYNRVMSTMYDDLRDFLVLHYCLSQRTDSEFWQAVRQPNAIPDSVQQMLEYFEHRLPFEAWTGNHRVTPFRDESYTCMLAGFNRFPAAANHYLDRVTPREVESVLLEHFQHVTQQATKYPDHEQLINELHDQGQPLPGDDLARGESMVMP